jgi:hypothetical protein
MKLNGAVLFLSQKNLRGKQENRSNKSIIRNLIKSTFFQT